jgi:hypothetical protein
MQQGRTGASTLSALVLTAVLSVGALRLAGCDSAPEAPTNVEICWRMAPLGSKPDFTPVNVGVHNLESCAANLEAVALRENRPNLTGAYQGQFIFITPDMVQSSMHLNGARYRLFDAVTRGKIDHNLRWMLDDEKHPSQFGPQAPPPK